MEYGIKYHNCLRLQITPDAQSGERINDLVSHCLKYGFDNVMLMINTEDFNRGHITREAAKEWVGVLKTAKAALEDAGISVSLNNWITMGHADRGMQPYPGQNFGYLTDMNGRTATFCTCPLDPAWRSYYMDYITFLIEELHPDTFWIEDDFRMHNHAPLSGVGCFCPLHMAEYNRRLGKNLTREEFVSRAFTPGSPTEERKVFLDVCWAGLRDLAATIVKTIKAADPHTEVGLMAAGPSHAIEGRDWKELFDVISDGGNKIHRIHMCYGEPSGKDYLWYCNSVSMPVRAASPSDSVIMPEVEHGPASQWGRSPRFLRFALDCAIPLVLSGMTYSIYDFIGNGVRESLGFGQVVRDQQPFMQAVLDIHLQFDSLAGVAIPTDTRSSYYLPIYDRGYQDLLAKEFSFAAYLSALGVSYHYTDKKNLTGETVFLCGDSVQYFDDDALTALFTNNYVIVEGTAALALADRGLLHLISAKSARRVKPGTGFHACEECADDTLIIEGVRKLRASGRANAGDFVDIVYDGRVVSHTDIMNHQLVRVANGFTEGDGFAVVPYCLGKSTPSQFCDLRRYFLLRTIAAQTKRVAIVGTECISPYLFRAGERSVLVLLNSNCDSYDTLTLTLEGVEFKTISRLNRDGTWEPVPFERNGNELSIRTNVEYYSATILVFA